MADEAKDVTDTAAAEVELPRARFRRLLAANPNYFGTKPEFGLPATLQKQNDTTYEVLRCVAYSPERDRLEATIRLRRPTGYSGELCTRGSYEHVRFYVSYDEGQTWDDAGVASVNVHDLPAAEDCQAKPVHPLTYVVGLDYQPNRDRCSRPVLPLVRAILSWEDIPPAGQPDWQPVWGNVRSCHARIRPRRFFLGDLAPKLPEDLLAEIPHYVLDAPPPPEPDPGPLSPEPLETLAKTYAQADVPPHRFALPHLLSAADAPALSSDALMPQAQVAQQLGIDLSQVVEVLENPAGDTTYEELFCVGLDNNTDQLVATFQVKRPSGYSGGPCTQGSIEYVSFWADFGSDCRYTYLGTAEVRVHDFAKLPDGGLCYAAILPVDLGKYRRDCANPVFGRVRAVLSWATPPSTIDPDAVPYWGNRIDAHVQLRPGRRYDGTALFTHVGGVDVDEVSTVTGLTLPGAHLAVNGVPLPDDCPFAGLVVLRGILDPALAGQQYRVLVRNLTTGGLPTELTNSFYVTPVVGPGYLVTPGAGGWTAWPSYAANTDGVLGVFAPGGNDRWEIQLELAGSGIVDVRTAQMDHLVRNTVDPADPANAGDLRLFTGGACRLPRGPLNGQFVARDEHFLSWAISVLGGPTNTVPPTPLTVGISTGTQTPLAGQPFTIDLSQLEPCGYVVRLTITDRAVVNSAYLGNQVNIDRGVCLE